MAETLTPPKELGPMSAWPAAKRGEPVWNIACRFPRQGQWTQGDYFTLPDDRGIELVDGFLEFLPMPTRDHQTLIGKLYIALVAILDLNRVQMAGYNLQTTDDGLRQPDVLATNDLSAFANDRATRADLAIEVVSPGGDNRRRDEVEKREEYALAGIPEYWIVDPENQSILVLTLDGDNYVELGCFKKGETATSKVIHGFSIAIDECFAALNK